MSFGSLSLNVSMITLPVSKIVIICSSPSFLLMNVEIEISVSVPIKVKPNSFNSNLTPVKIAFGFLLEIAFDTVFKAFSKLVLSEYKKRKKDRLIL